MDEYKITTVEIDENNVKSAADHISGNTAESNKNIFDKLPELIATKFNGFVDAVIAKFANYYTKEETATAINNKVTQIGTSDMSKAVYDSNDDGVVNDSDKLGGNLPSYYATKAELTELDNEAMKTAQFVFDETTATLNITL